MHGHAICSLCESNLLFFNFCIRDARAYIRVVVDGDGAVLFIIIIIAPSTKFGYNLNFNIFILHCSLNGNPLTDDGLVMIIQAVKNTTHLSSLDIGRCEISDKGAEAILDFLMTNSSLKELTLSHNTLGKEGWLYIASGLKCNNSLKTISLDACDIGDDEIKILAQGIEENKSLQCIDIECNVFTDHGAEMLVEAIKNCETLLDVTLQPCDMLSMEVQETVRNIIEMRF